MKKFLSLALGLVVIMSFNLSFAKTSFKLGIGDPVGSNAYLMADRFKSLSEIYSNGEIEITLYPACQLGSEQEMAQNVRLGTLDMALFGSSNLAPFVPAMNITCFPYLITSHDEAAKMTNGVAQDFLNSETIKVGNARILGWTLDGFRRLSNSSRPAATPEEFKGLKIRTPKNPLYLATYKAWNINAVPMAWDETYTALQQKVVDGQDVPEMLFYASKFHEVQKYITDVHFVYIMQPLIVNEKKFEKCPANIKEILIRAGKEASEFERQHLIVEEANTRVKLAKAGIVFVTPKEEEKLWEKPAREIWPQFYKIVGGEDNFKKIYDAVKGK